MARGAILRSRFIEKDGFRVHDPGEFVTSCAAHALMRAFKRKARALFMIKKRWLPFHAGVAFGTSSSPGFSELLAMDILVAVFALRWGGFEVHIE